MYQASATLRNVSYQSHGAQQDNHRSLLACDWASLRGQLLMQWSRLTKADLESTGPDRNKIAYLVQRKYGISAILIENYLTNLERTLPIQGGLYVH